VGYGDEAHDTIIELTHNWGAHDYALGTGFGHIALGVDEAALHTKMYRRAQRLSVGRLSLWT
jgi:hypothetical protein